MAAQVAKMIALRRELGLRGGQGVAQAVTTDQAGRVREQAAWALGMIESPEGARLPVVRAR